MPLKKSNEKNKSNTMKTKKEHTQKTPLNPNGCDNLVD